MTKKKFNTKYMVELSLMIALIIAMSFTPLGYIKTPALSITLLTIPVAVGAVILGPAGGAVCGAAFGLTSFYQAFGLSAFASALMMINPLGTFVTTVLTRVLEGFLTGLIFKVLKKTKLKKASFYIASLACPLLNTLLFMGSLVIFFYNSDFIQGFAGTLGATNPFTFVLMFVGLQGLIEAVICFLAGSILSKTLYKALKTN